MLLHCLQDQFCEYMFQQALKMDYKILLENKSKFVLVHSSSGFKHALKGMQLVVPCWSAFHIITGTAVLEKNYPKSKGISTLSASQQKDFDSDFCVRVFHFICSFSEVLQDPAVASRLADTKASGEVRSLEDFYQMLQNDPNRAFYG